MSMKSSQPSRTLGDDELKSIYASVAVPVAIVTAVDRNGIPFGTTVGSFVCISLSPSIVSFSLLLSSDLLAVLELGKRVNIHLPSANESDLARDFAAKGGPKKFENVDWRRVNGAPQIEELSCFYGEVFEIVSVGDHYVINVAVDDIAQAINSQPLLYHQRNFGTFEQSTT